MSTSRLHALVPPDFTRSPCTGLTRTHWLAAGLYMVEQMLAALPSMDAPLLFTKVPGKTYPQPGEDETRTRSAEFEGFVRSLNLVAPLLAENSELTMRGMRLLDYYHRELLSLIRHDSPRRVPLLSSLVTQDHEMRQMTCELGGLSVILLLYPQLWDVLAPADRDALAALLTDYAHGNTHAHNWRYFNIMMMVFLRHHGYPVDERLARAHHDALLALDAGQGWFRDNHFDYYNVWVFHLYAPIWCRAYGYQHEPEIAALLERQSHELMRTYPFFFARDGQMLMWGRSIAYRTGAISPIPVCYLFDNPPPLDPGWARRICSGNLLQFFERDEFLMNGVPSLGFYGHFEAALQGYSCSASPMWGHLNFLAMFSLPADSPLWTATENDGEWQTLPADSASEIHLDAPGFHVVNRPRTGHTELLSGKTEPDDPNYNRLAFHTAFLWESLDPAMGLPMHYTRRTHSPVTGEGQRMPVKMYWAGARDGVLYRQLIMSAVTFGAPAALDLADISLPTGTLRVDRPRLYFAGELRLCHYGLPHIGGQPAVVERRTIRGYSAITARIPGRQLALVALAGWDEIGATVHSGFNPEALESTVLWAEWRHAENFPTLSPRITLLLHKTDDAPWTDDELCPVASFETQRLGDLGLHGTRARLVDGREFRIDYTGIEGIKQD